MKTMEHGVVTQRVIVLLLSLVCFMNLPKKAGSPGITKIRGFHHCAKDFNSQLLNACKTLLKTLYLFW